jgi:hypothetical protein
MQVGWTRKLSFATISVCSVTDRASDYGSEGWEFESLQAHTKGFKFFLTESSEYHIDCLELKSSQWQLAVELTDKL